MAIEYTEALAAIGAENFDKIVAFYTAILGRDPDERIQDAYVAFHLPGLRLGIFKPRPDNAELFHNPPDRETGLSLVLRVSDVEKAVAELERLNAPACSPIMNSSHGREVYGYDPNGNRLILVEHVG